jgi:hypothetical protein
VGALRPIVIIVPRRPGGAGRRARDLFDERRRSARFLTSSGLISRISDVPAKSEFERMAVIVYGRATRNLLSIIDVYEGPALRDAGRDLF